MIYSAVSITAPKKATTAKRTETAPEYARPAEYSIITGISDNNQITPAKNTTKKRTAERILKKRFIKQKNKVFINLARFRVTVPA